MRILHTSDWHLGRALHGVDLLDHQAAYLDHLVDLARTEHVDAVLVSGDVYDRAVPPVDSVDLLASSLSRLAEHTQVVLTPGNHDSATRLGFAADLLTERVRLQCRVADAGRPLAIPGPDGRTGLWVYPLPYLDPDMARADLAEPGGDPPGRSHEAVVAAAMRRVHTDLDRRRATSGERVPAAVMAHAFVVGGLASESERDIRVGGVDSVPAGLFENPSDLGTVDYVALGHLHGPQRVGRDGAGPVLRYAGSPLAYSFSEQRHHKSTALVELSASGVASVELVSAPVPRPLLDVSGTLEELRSRAFDDAAEAWVRVFVTDEIRPADLYTSVLRRFPHALVVRHQPPVSFTRSEAVRVDAALDPLEIAGEFVHAVGGRRPTREEMQVLRDAYEGALTWGRSA